MDSPARTESRSLASAPLRESEASFGSSTRKTRALVSSAPSQVALLKEQRTRSSGIDSAEKVPIVSVDPPVPTTKVLEHFEKVVSRGTNRERKNDTLDYYKITNQRQRQTLDRLKQWADAAIRPSIDWVLSFALKCYRRPLRPDDEELITLARHFYPLRGELRVHVCDFGDDHAEHFETKLAEIERCMKR